MPIYLSCKDSKSALHGSLSSPDATDGDNINNLFFTLFKIGIFLPIYLKKIYSYFVSAFLKE